MTGTNRYLGLKRPSSQPRNLERAKLKEVVRQLETEKSNLAQKVSATLSEVELLRKELQQLKEQSLLDELTQVKNRKGFNLILQQEVGRLADDRFQKNRVQVASASLGLLVIDADFFKQVNDQYGHEVGDQVLIAISAVLVNSVRTYDVVCRWGGEEFAVVMPGIDEIGLKYVGEKIRSAVAEIIFAQHDQLEVTVSIGGAIQRLQSDEGLMSRADKAMYAAKKNGRNQVIIADS